MHRLNVQTFLLAVLLALAPFFAHAQEKPVAKPPAKDAQKAAVTPKSVCDRLKMARDMLFKDKVSNADLQQSRTMAILALKDIKKIPAPVLKLSGACSSGTDGRLDLADAARVKDRMLYEVQEAIGVGVDVTQLLSEEELQALADHKKK